MCLGIPGRIAAIADAGSRTAIVEIAGIRRLVDISLVADPAAALDSYIGDWVLVHVGFAMSRLDQAKAMEMIELLADLDEFS